MVVSPANKRKGNSSKPIAAVSTPFAAIEKKWQKRWESKKIFNVSIDKKKPKCYVLEMYPYPSASFLHMGHVRNYTIGDIYARFKRMNGFNVLYPMGYDSFGLPAEIAAKKQGIHPEKYTNHSIEKIKEYQKALGNSYDWSRVIASHDPEYYRWNQFFFLKMFEKGLAYRKKAPVNWCENCQSVLANEESEGGKCWRCGNDVVKRDLEQWFFKITEYADRLLADLEKVEWPEKIKEMQRNWIGRSEGTKVLFGFEGSKEKIEVFTTRPDTLMGVTFLVYAAQHPKVAEFVKGTKYEDDYQAFIKKSSTSQKLEAEKEKEGFFTGKYAIHPLTDERLPIYAANFVLADYGTGVVMAVPAHDQRDFEFANKYKIPIKQVITPVFKTTQGKDAVRDDKKTVERNSIFAIVKHWKEDKYFCLDWKKFAWKSLIIGGVESGEDFKEAAIREVKEETGYQDIKSVREIGWENHGYYFAEHKDVNRYAKFKTFLVELRSDKYTKPEDEQVKNHEGNWVDKDKVASYLNLSNNKFVWDIYLKGESAFVDSGVLINSDKFNGLQSEEAKKKITEALKSKKMGGSVTQYKLRDWLISRQRYWGTPIPIIHCENCGVVPVSEKDLPVKLPTKVDFNTTGNPLATSKTFVETRCPKCKGKAKRETDTMGGFVDSSWYFLRYCDPQNKKQAFDVQQTKYWMPVDQYIGGAEHAVMHLMYARFFVKVLHDLGYCSFDEPFTRLFNQGIVYKNGAKMSKSKGNVVFQTDIASRYGIDTARLFVMMVASPDKQMEWSDEGIEGAYRIINRVLRAGENLRKETDEREESRLNKTIKIVSEAIEVLDYPKAIVALIALLDGVPSFSRKGYESFLKMFSVFCPHSAEEEWEQLGNKGFISLASWPISDTTKIQEKFDKIDQAVEKTVADVLNVLNIVKEKSGKDAQKVYLYVMPFELEYYDPLALQKRVGKEVFIFAVNDKNKYDPEGKAAKAKPGKPGIYVI